MEIDMPESGFGLHVQEYRCRFCGPRRATSFYVHPDVEEHLGMTKERFAELIHLSDCHTYRKGSDDTWAKHHPYRWYAERLPLRPFDTAYRWIKWKARKLWHH